MTSRFEMAYYTMSSAAAWLLYIADAVYSLSFIYSSPLSFIFGSSIHVFSNSTFFGTRSPLVLALCVEAVGYKLRVWIHVPSTKLCGTHKYQGE